MTITYYRLTKGLALAMLLTIYQVIAVPLEPFNTSEGISKKARITSVPTTKIRYKTKTAFTPQERQKLQQIFTQYRVYSAQQTANFAGITLLLSGKSKRLVVSEGDWLKTPVDTLPENGSDIFWLVRPALVQQTHLPLDKKIFTVIAKATRKQTVQDSVYMLITEATAEVTDKDYLVAAEAHSPIPFHGESTLIGRIISPLLVKNQFLQAEQLVWVELDGASIMANQPVERGTVLAMHEMIDVKSSTSETQYNVIKQPSGELVLLHYFPVTQLALGYLLTLNNKRDSDFIVQSLN